MVDLFSQKFIGAVQDQWGLYSNNALDYTLGQPIGHGSSSTVYSATYNPPSEPPIPCAVKVLDLDRLPPRSLRLLQQEATLMSLSKHPNVLRVRGTWAEGSRLYIAMRLMNKGSAADVMRYGWPGGMDEEVVRCILRQALQGLNYLHINGFIHRDIKAANLLIDDDGRVLLGDLGVAASLNDSIHHGSNTFTVPLRRPSLGKRKSFVGTPCWMSPELIQGHQYDSASDIWSFGITALELAQGRPPRSRDNKATVLLKIVRDPPPELDRVGGIFKYSRAFKEMVESCLAKDPSERPSAEQLLQLPFFKGAKKKSYLVGAILQDLPPMATRLEKRGISNHSTHAHSTIGSWDFSLSHTCRAAPHGLPLPTLAPNEEQAAEDVDNSGQEDDSSAPTTPDEEARMTDADPAGPGWKPSEVAPGGKSSGMASPALTPSTSWSTTSIDISRGQPASAPSSSSVKLWRRLVRTYSATETRGRGEGSPSGDETMKTTRSKWQERKTKMSHIFSFAS